MTRVASTKIRPASGTAVRAFGALCQRLDPGWRTIRNRCIAVNGEQYRIHFILVHRDYGIGLIVFSPDDYVVPEMALRITRQMLRENGFERRFGSRVPIVFVALDPQDYDNAPAQIAHAFQSAPAISVKDPTWVDWVASAFNQIPSFDDGDFSAGNQPTWTANDGVAEVDLCAAGRKSWRLALRSGLIVASLGVCAIIFQIAFATFSPIAGKDQSSSAPQRTASRLISEENLAGYLGLELREFQAKQEILRAKGFPAPEIVTGNYDKAAVDRWLDMRSDAQ
jgi:hypothetical protein